jgi:hypothetical protein
MTFRSILTTLALCLTFDARAALIHQYEFNGNLADTLGGPALVANGGTVAAGRYGFAANQGLRLHENLGATYTIDMRFRFDTLGTWQKVVDFSGLLQDYGFYTSGSGYDLYNYGGAYGHLKAKQDTHLTLTRGADAAVRIYQDGVLVGTVADSKGYADFAGHDANFFRDDRGLNEAAAGSVDFIRIYDNVLTQAQVYALMDPSKVPEPASAALMVMGLSLLGLSVGKGRRAKR